MRVPSSILSVLKHHAGVADPGDEVIQVPGVALPVLQLPGGLSDATPNINSANPRAESFLVSFSQTLSNVALQQITVVAFRPGLWRVHIWLALGVDITPTLPSSVVRVGLMIPNTAANFVPLIMAFQPGGGAGPAFSFANQVERQFSFERDAAIVLETEAVGLGRTLLFEISVYAARLL